jgi:uncharacterized protein YbjT (DUF2867 family)
MEKTAIVIGATGLVGHYLLDLLLQDPSYRTIITFARRHIDRDHPKLVQKGFPSADRLLQEVKCDDLFCTLGTTIKKAGSKESFRQIDFDLPLSFAKAACQNGTKHFLLVSAMGAQSKGPFFYGRIKGQIEEAIIQVGFPSCTIVRPSLLLGPRAENRRGEKIGEKVLGVLNPLLVGPLADLRPVHARDVARCLVKAAQSPPDGSRIILSSEIKP